MTELDRVADPWEQLERVPPGSLVQARETLHWAAQIPGAAGHSLVPPEPGDGHTALRWDDALRGLATDPGPGFRVALLPEPMALLLLLDEGGPVSRLELDGRTLEDALAWLERAIAELPAPVPRQQAAA